MNGHGDDDDDDGSVLEIGTSALEEVFDPIVEEKSTAVHGVLIVLNFERTWLLDSSAQQPVLYRYVDGGGARLCSFLACAMYAVADLSCGEAVSSQDTQHTGFRIASLVHSAAAYLLPPFRARSGAYHNGTRADERVVVALVCLRDHAVFDPGQNVDIGAIEMAAADVAALSHETMVATATHSLHEHHVRQLWGRHCVVGWGGMGCNAGFGVGRTCSDCPSPWRLRCRRTIGRVVETQATKRIPGRF